MAPDALEAHRELEPAGFAFESEGRFLRSSNDGRDWRLRADWFLLSFRKKR